jgi:MoxR-like ATPase
LGKPQIVAYSLTTLLAGGHLLIEDVPGVGKTTLALALASSIGGKFQRIQFTSDLLPADILGVSVLNPQTNAFEFRPGPLFHQVILADELNRASPRTQSALLEAMNERQVTLDNHTYPLPAPFFVIATQNPHDHHGTFPLPESQLDRFMMRLSIGYPDSAHEKSILMSGTNRAHLHQMRPCLTVAEALMCIEQTAHVRVAPAIDDYILTLVQATRTSPRIEVGVSPRGALALRRAVQAYALLGGREHAIPDDVKALAIPVLAHRLIFTADSSLDNREEAERFMASLLDTLPVPL